MTTPYTTQNALLYRGFELHVEEPSWIQDGNASVERRVIDVQNPIGQIRELVRTQVAKSDLTFGWHMDERHEIDAFMDFVYRRRGTYEPFWTPTWKHDLWLVTDVAADDATITIRACGYTTRMFPFENRRHLIFLDQASQYVIRRVVASVENGDGTETLELESAVGKAFGVRQTEVCFLVIVRQSDDTVQIVQSGIDFYIASMGFTEVPEELQLGVYTGLGAIHLDSDDVVIPVDDSGPCAGVTCPFAMPWIEGFDQADYVHFRCLYLCYNPPLGPLHLTDIPLDGHKTVAGSALTASQAAQTGGPLVFAPVIFGPPNPFAPPVPEFWMQAEVEIIGVPYDVETHGAFQFTADGNNGTFLTETSLFLAGNSADTFSDPTMYKLYASFYGGSGTAAFSSGVANAMPVGTYTFKLHGSLSSATLWIKDASGTVHSVTAPVFADGGLVGYQMFQAAIYPHLDPAGSVRISSIEVHAGASDPFPPL